MCQCVLTNSSFILLTNQILTHLKHFYLIGDHREVKFLLRTLTIAINALHSIQEADTL